ncbi:rhodanese-like domain-containing protein [Nocardioides sp. GXQ0305]|uniref:rhodanese-like domain-containing protein n=1 Tax=Nocardioides sp. GXQ0305 TaxID=3423912 RepID=UPI003D7E52B4
MSTTTPEVTVFDLARALTGDATMVDVREHREYVRGHVPGALLVPMGQVPARLGEIDGSGRVYVVCASGHRSRVAADVLRTAGYDAVSVAGGTDGWHRAGGPLVTGSRPTA